MQFFQLTPRRRPATLLIPSCLWVCCALLLTGAHAQDVQLSTLKPRAGESVTITGDALNPGGQVTAQLTAPGGRVSRESAQVGEKGRFSLDITVPTGGRYQLVVRGQGVEKTWQLTVPKPSASAEPPSAQTPPPAQNAQSLTPEPDPFEAAALQVTRTENGIKAAQNGTPLWELTFPKGSGSTTQPLFQRKTGADAQLYLGHGNSVLKLEPQTGDVSERFIVSGPVARLETVDDETVGITVRHSDTLLERFTLQGGELQEPVRFGTDPRTFSYLRAEANVPNPTVSKLTARLRRDPTNPWLYLKMGLSRRNSEAARVEFTEAVRTAATFYDLAGLATVLEQRGERALAERAFDRAMRDFAARDYDPRLLTDGELEAAYNFPLGPLQAALERNDDLSAGRWAERLWLAAPRVPGAAAAFTGYAALLRRVGTPDEAALWEGRAAQQTAAGENGLERLGLTLARAGWSFVPALLVAFFVLHLTLLAKYARPRRSDYSSGLIGGRLPWLFALRYDTLSEKLVLLALLALTLVSAALGSWAARGEPPAQVVGSGTLGNRVAQAYLNETAQNADFSGPRAAFVRGTAQQVLGDTPSGNTQSGNAQAESLLREAGNYAPALNNLGVLTGDEAFYTQALGLEPNLPAARYNTGDRALLPFQAKYAPDQPALALPTPNDFQVASGSWQGALGGVFTHPQRALSTPPYGFSLVLWRILQVLFLLIALVHVAFLFVPRPRSAHGAPRGWVYQLCALLFPGTGLADEMWGIFLLVPWAVLGAAALELFGLSAPAPLTLSLVLAGIYALNTVAVIIEGVAYRTARRGLELRYSVRKA